jgi:hypothetical protein
VIIEAPSFVTTDNDEIKPVTFGVVQKGMGVAILPFARTYRSRENHPIFYSCFDFSSLPYFYAAKNSRLFEFAQANPSSKDFPFCSGLLLLVCLAK